LAEVGKGEVGRAGKVAEEVKRLPERVVKGSARAIEEEIADVVVACNPVASEGNARRGEHQ
jgi:hypothetical protein